MPRPFANADLIPAAVGAGVGFAMGGPLGAAIGTALGGAYGSATAQKLSLESSVDKLCRDRGIRLRALTRDALWHATAIFESAPNHFWTVKGYVAYPPPGPWTREQVDDLVYEQIEAEIIRWKALHA